VFVVGELKSNPDDVKENPQMQEAKEGDNPIFTTPFHPTSEEARNIQGEYTKKKLVLLTGHKTGKNVLKIVRSLRSQKIPYCTNALFTKFLIGRYT